MGYDLEVDMIRLARERDLLTAPYVFDAGRGPRRWPRPGADVLVPHVGLTTKGSIGASTALTLDEAVERVQAMRDAAKAVRPGRPRPLPRRPDRRAGRRGATCCPAPRASSGFFGASLGRAAADRAGDHRAGGRLQVAEDLSGRLPPGSSARFRPAAGGRRPVRPWPGSRRGRETPPGRGSQGSR